MKKVVIFASGTGTNAENIIKYFSDDKNVTIDAIVSNNKNANVLDIANRHTINGFYFNKPAFYSSDYVLRLLSSMHPDLIILAGFLWKIPESIVRAFPGKIINIHPALLPKYGGKGMYGMHVHRAVVRQKETETGITIHYVNENYDEGAIIFQEKTAIIAIDTPEDVSEKVRSLEHRYFPEIIEKVLYGKI